MQRIASITAIIATLAIGISLTLTSGARALDREQEVKNKITANFERFETILNAKGDPEDLLEFLHTTIDNDAEITLQIQNPEVENGEAIDVKVSKADYINSYLYGPRQVQNYQIDITTVDVTWDQDTETVTSREVLTEQGIAKDPAKPNASGQEFISRTTCESEHSVNDDEIVLQATACRTQISYLHGV